MRTPPASLAAILIAGLALATPVLAQAPPAPGQATPTPAEAADPIAARQAGMKRTQADIDAIKKVVDANGDVKPLVPQAQAVADWDHRIVGLFPPGSDAGKTKAKPEIWTNFADFQLDANDAATQANKLVTLAQADDKAGFADQFRTTYAACGTCHRHYRNR